MKAFLRTKSLWTIIRGTEKHPDDSKANLQAKWDVRADKATGQLYHLLSVEQRNHIEAVQDNPAQIWTTLESLSTSNSILELALMLGTTFFN